MEGIDANFVKVDEKISLTFYGAIERANQRGDLYQSAFRKW